MFKVVRHIQLNKISYTPPIYKAIITYQPYSNEYDESDEVELNKQKLLMNKLVDKKWFINNIKQNNGYDPRELWD